MEVIRRRQRRRAATERLKARVPSWYSPLVHVLGNVVLTAAAVSIFASQLGHGETRWWAWLAFPIALMVGNVIEYSIHRYPMHKRTRWLGRFFKGHTLIHHRVFDQHDFDIKAGRDVYFVLTTVHTTVVSIAFMAVFYVALRLLVGADVAGVAFIGFAVYALSVELMHLLLHVPERWFTRWPLRSKLLLYLREHHRIHHDPKLMTKYNFNLAFPLTDFFVGSRYLGGDESAETNGAAESHA
jgi:hypothetical protein